MASSTRLLLGTLVLVLAAYLVAVDGFSDEKSGTCTSSNNGAAATCQDRTPADSSCSVKANAAVTPRHRAAAAAQASVQACRLYLAQSTIPDSGLGVFTAVPLPRGRPIGPPDIVIQIPDADRKHVDGLSLLLSDYLWDGQETGGQYEGQKVYSTIPGLGMLANGHLNLYNALPFRPDVDEANVPRTTSPGAGGFSHYHNYSFYSQRPIEAGGEVFVNYGSKWFREREGKKVPPPIADDDDTQDTAALHTRSQDWLQENGSCLDNIRAGPSTIEHAGRGAFAVRYLREGSVIAPAPVIPITNRDALQTVRIKAGSPKKGQRDVAEEGWQLLLNYCYGHANSSVLLLPYGMAVNFINHDPARANAVLRWSNSTQHRGGDWPTKMSLEEVKSLDYSGLMLDFVATRDIRPGEEIVIDYGREWEKAWNHHVNTWKPAPGSQSYTPSYVMDDVATVVRTEEEQRDFPYGDNLITSCFYRYSDNNSAKVQSDNGGGSSSVETTAVRWEMKRGLFEYNNLRPCSILRRDKTPDGKNNWYTVLIRNRYGLDKEERIPKGMMHVVNFVPRHAIRFSDKLYTTDQHLSSAFRHEIGLPDGIFPEAWMDLA